MKRRIVASVSYALLGSSLGLSSLGCDVPLGDIGAEPSLREEAPAIQTATAALTTGSGITLDSLQYFDPTSGSLNIESEDQASVVYEGGGGREGAIDWVYLGANRSGVVASLVPLERARGSVQHIRNEDITKIGTAALVSNYEYRPVATFNWLRGTPTLRAVANPWDSPAPTRVSGVVTNGVGNGFKVSLPAPVADVTTRVWGRIINGKGQVTLRLTDNSAPAVTRAVDSSLPFVVMASFRAGNPNVRLEVSITVTEAPLGASNAAAALYGARLYWPWYVAPGIRMDPSDNGDLFAKPMFLDQNQTRAYPVRATSPAGLSFTKVELYENAAKIAEDSSSPFEFTLPHKWGRTTYQVKGILANGRSVHSNVVIPHRGVRLAATGVGTIPDNNATGLSKSWNLTVVPGGTKVTSTSVQFDIAHSYIGDLDLVLVNPSSTQARIVSQVGGSSDNFPNVYFGETGSSQSNFSFPLASGSGWRPLDGFATLMTSASSNGNWTFRAYDRVAYDQGTLNAVELKLGLDNSN